MKQIPVTVVLTLLLLVTAAWPSMQTWSTGSSLHHWLYHLLFAFAGGFLGLQTAWWIGQASSIDMLADESGVSS